MTQQPLTHHSRADVTAQPRTTPEHPPAPPIWKRAPLSWASGFAMFWYHFIIGDDWTLAAVVAVGLAVTALLHAHGVSIWWLVPALVIVIVGIDLERASRRLRKR